MGRQAVLFYCKYRGKNACAQAFPVTGGVSYLQTVCSGSQRFGYTQRKLLRLIGTELIGTNLRITCLTDEEHPLLLFQIVMNLQHLACNFQHTTGCEPIVRGITAPVVDMPDLGSYAPAGYLAQLYLIHRTGYTVFKYAIGYQCMAGRIELVLLVLVDPADTEADTDILITVGLSFADITSNGTPVIVYDSSGLSGFKDRTRAGNIANEIFTGVYLNVYRVGQVIFIIICREIIR